MTEVTKESVVGLLGSTDGFSSDAVKKQLAIREAEALKVLAAYRAEKGLVRKATK